MDTSQTTQCSIPTGAAVNRKKSESIKATGYYRHWEHNGETLDSDEARSVRKSQYTEVVNEYAALRKPSVLARLTQLYSYYDAATDLWLESWGQSFHMCRYPRGPENKENTTARHEHYLAHMMSLRPGMRVLDVGCGVGGPSKELATVTLSA
jgi:sterol 24-C-methyltransferase